MANQSDWDEVRPNVYMLVRSEHVKPAPIIARSSKPRKTLHRDKPGVRQRTTGKFASISVVMMTHNRGGLRLRNTLDSLLCHQSYLPKEVVVVDTSTDNDIANGNKGIVALYPNAYWVRKKRSVFSKSWALNYGIRSCTKCSTFLACMDVDVMLSSGFIKTAIDILRQSKAFLLVDTYLAPRNIDIDPFDNWPVLLRMCTKAKPRGPGSFQACERRWWFNTHGYDERFSGGLGGMDDDIWVRAKKSGLNIVWIPSDKAQAVHQWHERSPLKGRTSHLFSHDPKVVVNPNGWGK